LGMSVWAGAAAPARAWLVGAGSGLIAALVGLLLLGTKLADAGSAGDAAQGLKPNAAMMAAGFIVLGAFVGLIGGAIGGAIGGRRREVSWLGRLALVAAASVAPLGFICGLVARGHAGEAVAECPRTAGA